MTIASSGQPAGETGGRPGDPAVTGRLVTLARAVERSRDRRWGIRRILLVVGAGLMGLGFVVIVLGWYGAANSAYLYQEIPYVISGGLLGLALVAAGGFLFFSAWLVRLVEETHRHTDRVVLTLDRVDRLLGALTEGAPSVGTVARPAAGTDRPGPPASAGPGGENR